MQHRLLALCCGCASRPSCCRAEIRRAPAHKAVRREASFGGAARAAGGFGALNLPHLARFVSLRSRPVLSDQTQTCLVCGACAYVVVRPVATTCGQLSLSSHLRSCFPPRFLDFRQLHLACGWCSAGGCGGYLTQSLLLLPDARLQVRVPARPLVFPSTVVRA